MTKYRTELEYIGEGLTEDYDSSDEQDYPHLRFTVLVKHGDEWEQVDDASYCTTLCDGLYNDNVITALEKMITGIAVDLDSYIQSGSGYRRRFEELSHLDHTDMILLSKLLKEEKV